MLLDSYNNKKCMYFLFSYLSKVKGKKLDCSVGAEFSVRDSCKHSRPIRVSFVVIRVPKNAKQISADGRRLRTDGGLRTKLPPVKKETPPLAAGASSKSLLE